jgi:hypothetical protein
VLGLNERKEIRLRRTLTALICAVVAVTTPTALAGTPIVTGGGKGVFPAGTPLFAGDPIQVELTAHGNPLESGWFNTVHHSRFGFLIAHFSGDLTCVTKIGNTAFATGIVTHGRTIAGFDPRGIVVAITIVDDGQDDLFGVDVDFFPPHPIAPCQPAPLFGPVTEGNFTVY